MTADPYAQAAQTTTQQAATAEDLEVPAREDDNGAELALFGGERLPSFFSKQHDVGAERTGIIKDLPFQRHSRTFVEDGVGKLKYWQDGADRPVTNPVNLATGKPNRPCMDTVIPLSTDYRDRTDVLDPDDGSRGWTLSGNDLKAFREAIKKAKVPNMAALVGKRITAKRTGKIQAGDFKAWLYEVTITG